MAAGKALAAIFAGAAAYYTGHKSAKALNRRDEKRFRLGQEEMRDLQGRVNRAFELKQPPSQVRDFGRVVGPDKKINYIGRGGLSGGQERYFRSIRMGVRWPGVDFKQRKPGGVTLKEYLAGGKKKPRGGPHSTRLRGHKKRWHVSGRLVK